jgi:protein PsiE|tara:strand:- start:1002 stop:1430 length:429 start_codon:yes stop_codon:yes gene_type:complete
MIRETDWSKKLHWTTTASEKVLLGFIGTLTMIAAGLDIYRMVVVDMKIELGDLFLLFIYAEIVGMVGAFYSSNRIPVTLPIIIAITALCRLIVLHSKEADPWMLFAEAGAIAILAGAAYMMSLKDKLSLDKELRRKRLDKSK